MLLSHNFNLYNQELPALNREEFAQVFIDGLKQQNALSCKLVKNPHWIVEIIFSREKYSASAIGKKCGQILAIKRQEQKMPEQKMPDILILGGKKTTPATNNNPSSLQPGEWGVDVVETVDKSAFLASIQWEMMIASKPADDIFKIEISGK